MQTKIKKMNLKQIGTLLLISFTILIAATCPGPTPGEKESVLIKTLLSGLAQTHYAPVNIDDEFSKKVYKVYLDRLDNGKRFMIQSDVDVLKSYELKLDDQANAGTFEFLNKSVTFFDSGVDKAEKYFIKYAAAPIDYKVTETIEMDGEKKPFPKDDKEMDDSWRKLIKYEIISRVSNKLDAQEKKDKRVASTDSKTVVTKSPDSLNTKIKTRDELEVDVRTELKKSYGDWFKRLHKQKRSDKLELYLNSISNVYDPHTEYFEPIEKQNFDISMSGRLIGIGARLQVDPETEYTKISEVITGGPAWKTKLVEDGDMIQKVAQGDAEPVDIAGMDINDVVQMIRGKENTEVRLTIKKKSDGSITVVKMMREEVIFDEGYAKSLIIKDEKKNDIGYIKLPKFYADFDNDKGHFCAADIATEVLKLKKSGVKGIILDLRNNGGGSLNDVVKMSGQFIDVGPMVQVKAKEMKPDMLNDTESGTLWDGPFVIMVNEFSASASEIMAAAMQDYKRAIIVGSPTYGKGTVQRFFDLDKAISGNNDVKPLGQVKVTIQKFFRINGSSTQLKGVVPDIILPSTYSGIKMGERDNEYPMPYDQIAPAKYTLLTKNLKNLVAITEKSKKRISVNPTFKLITENASRIKESRDQTAYNLNFDAYRAYQNKQKDLAKKFDDLYKPIDKLNVKNVKDDVGQIEADKSKKARNEEWLKDVKKDPYIFETLGIIYDMM
jgi:carboxyl-terminal processing protease